MFNFKHNNPKLSNEFSTLPKKVRYGILIALLIAFNIALTGIAYRILDGKQLQIHTEQQAVLNVATMKAPRGPSTEEIVLPGTVQAWHEATLYARRNGYVQSWFTDIGAQVKEGDLLAIIETPEVDAQLLQAEAELKTAIANYEIAVITDNRWQNLLKTESVSQQAADEKSSARKASLAEMEAAKANVEYLQSLVGFQRIIAPFDGVITARHIDIGSLITLGSNSSDPALFHIIQSNPLRVYVRVPQNYAPRLTEDMEVKLFFTEHPGKSFPATLSSTAEGIDRSTRTLLAEFVADNSDYTLLPGSYTEVHLNLPLPDYIVRLPVNTLLFRAENLQVATINPDGVVELKSVVVGRDFGDELEIVSGVTEGETIILNPADSLMNGQKVNVIQNSTTKAKK